jgi:hypothetical protein
MKLLSTSIAAFVLFLCLAPLAWAQNADTQMRSKEIQREGLRGATEKDMGWPEEEDEEFGKIQTLKAAKKWFVMPYASARGYWTSNALLANKGEKGDTVFVETQGLNAGYRLTKDWNVQAGYNYQLTRYDENPVLDVDAHNANFLTSYQLPWDFQLSAGVNGMWLISPDQKVEVYRENNPFASLVRSQNFLDGRLYWYYGYQYDHKYSNPVGFERDEHSVFTGVSYAWLSNLVSQVGLRQNWQFYDYRPPAEPVNGRQEWVSSVALQTIWQPLSWLQISAYGLAVYDNSVNANRDYKVANCGGEIRAFWKF